MRFVEVLKREVCDNYKAYSAQSAAFTIAYMLCIGAKNECDKNIIFSSSFLFISSIIALKKCIRNIDVDEVNLFNRRAR